MSQERNIRISKVLKDFNISLDRAIDMLQNGGFRIEHSPNSKLSQLEYDYLYHFIKGPIIIEKQTITNQFQLAKKRDKLGMPETVFKYFGIQDYNIESLEKGYLYYSSYKNFNDPFDCNFNLINFEKDKKRTRHKKKEEVLKENFNGLGICCFSRNINSILMWSHYSANHKGFCIEFNANLDLDGINPLDVIYVNDFLQAEYYKDGKDSIFHMIFTKAKDWEYENELRIIKNKLFTEDSRKIPFRKNDIKSHCCPIKKKPN